MKRLKHKFTNQYYANYICYYETCIYCGKLAGNLYEELESQIKQLFPHSNNISDKISDLYSGQLEILNNHTLCLTEDEYIIKSIIE